MRGMALDLVGAKPFTEALLDVSSDFSRNLALHTRRSARREHAVH
jgi:hypothetical protein